MNKIRTLIIDDDKDFLEAAYEFLKNEKDFEVVGIATNGHDGIDKTLSNPPALVILDMVMKEGDGIEYLQELQKKNIKKPTIIVTSSLMGNTLTSVACELGVDYFLVKPFDLEHLAYISKKLVTSKAANRNKDVDLLSLFDSRHRGTLFIKKAVEIVKENPKLIIDINNIFKILAKEHFVMSLNQVRWNVDKAIKYTWDSHKIEIIHILNITDDLKPNLRAILDYYLRSKK